MTAFYETASDDELARHVNLALLMCDGISEQDAGFDKITGINDAGLAAVARIIGRVRMTSPSEEVRQLRMDNARLRDEAFLARQNRETWPEVRRLFRRLFSS
jgi:hypothetical protein